MSLGPSQIEPSLAEAQREVEKTAAENRAVTRGFEAQKAEGSRRWIAWSIVWMFNALVVVIMSLFCIAAFWTKYAQGLIGAADRVRELANVLLLPIVTLVLGYYFGKQAE